MVSLTFLRLVSRVVTPQHSVDITLLMFVSSCADPPPFFDLYLVPFVPFAGPVWVHIDVTINIITIIVMCMNRPAG